MLRDLEVLVRFSHAGCWVLPGPITNNISVPHFSMMRFRCEYTSVNPGHVPQCPRILGLMSSGFRSRSRRTLSRRNIIDAAI